MRDDQQQEALAFLRNPRSYPHAVRNIEEIETHISHVFLTGAHAYKLKKSVRFDFLDFSTLEKRKHFCEEEFRLNARFSPDIYEAVLSISRTNAKLHFGDGNEAVDYVVKMKQFGSDQLLSSLESRGLLNNPLLQQTTEVIARFHQRAEQTPAFWGPEDVAAAIRENIFLCGKFSPVPINDEALTELTRNVEAEMQLRNTLIAKRKHTHVRAVHGDLHLHNMCYYDGRAHLFDGIEFNPRLSNCDVWADLAFFVMDLLVRERFEGAAFVWNSYLQETDDFEGIELLNLYLSYRAAVRAKVNCLRLETAADRDDRAKLSREAADYIDLARYCLRPSRGKIIAIGGLSGSGKSTLASHLAQRLRAVHIRSDAVRKHLCGVPLYKAAPPEAYSEEMNRKTYEGMFERARHVLRSGRTAIFDAVFHSPVWRNEVESLAQRVDAPFSGFWCDVSPVIAKTRIRTRLEDISDADEGILSKQQTLNLGDIAWTSIDTSGKLSETLELIQERCPV